MAPAGQASPWRALGDLAHVGFAFVVATALGLGAGYYADRWLGSNPWLTLVGLGLGIAAGFVNFFRSIRAAQQDENDAR
ncbi:MAG: AtpZ/AtpI family protein [Candidatus Rokubacteria bacterium]|nr:AtpZ/AtpI family protein [Candidatus Rokubacteria bacterium]